MSAKIINSHRYKKTTRKKANDKKEQKYKYLTNKKKNEFKYMKQKQKKDKKKNNETTILQAKQEVNHLLNIKDNVKPQSNYFLKIAKVGGAVLGIFLITFLSKEIVNLEDSSIVKVFSNKDEETKFEKDYTLKVGMTGLDTTNLMSSKNIILKEMEKISSVRLIEVNKDYTITYLAAKTIDKVSNKEYNVLLNDKYQVTIEDFRSTVDQIKSLGEASMYYQYFSNIESIEEISENQFKIKLINDNPYFLYALDFPLSSASKKREYKIGNVTDTSITFDREESESTIKSLDISNYEDADKMLEDFRNQKIDVFFTSSNNAMQLIGKHEYNVKKYRNGEAIFILGNKDSAIFLKKEIRQGIVYSLNREEIVKSVNSNFGELIDLPYIYSDIKYKYDVYGARNIMLSNSWRMGEDGVYIKEENDTTIRAELVLLVNSDDTNKMKIAEEIKNMCFNSGILIQIVAVPQDEVSAKIANKEYDIVLADVLINEYPDISYLSEYVEINQEVANAISQVKDSNISSLSENIINLQNVLSEEVACIGIFARNINVVYQKDIEGFENIKYFKVFDNLENIGKKIDKIGG